MSRYVMPDYKLARDLDARMVVKPSQGWVNAIRHIAGLSVRGLAARLQVDPSTISKFEKAERTGSITIERMRAIANDLGCELEVRLVPATTFEALADDCLTKINAERATHKKGRLRKPARREVPTESNEAEELWRSQSKFASQRKPRSDLGQAN